ncbi:acyl-CoA dehydrogenase family protein [Martelella soudanensis]|uniref:acyl-CoA dehydrogenase family protein n=1 Tax=unclassified Martelella TaxID=2629616 RepID=UPI0015DE5CE0|nr:MULTISPECIES: acyl-CoA dehydrogenase family protein [unclassified Martelella]
MLFEPNDDQQAFLAMLEKMMTAPEAGFRAGADWARFEWSASFDRLLEEQGFYDCAPEETLGPAAAATLIGRLARLPVTVEAAASALIRPLVGAELPRPIAVIEGAADRPTRFLPVAKTVIRIDDDGVSSAPVSPASCQEVASLFAYPMSVLSGEYLDWNPIDIDPEVVRTRWRVAVAAELAGVLAGGFQAVLAHVRERRQFGRPLGAFQSIQHRLAEAVISIEAGELMVQKAAQTGDPAMAALSLGYIQEASGRIAGDLHQFMGAMGLTLEHPLHRWTYRAKLLKSALGGAGENQTMAADRLWGN